jgi:hypothetical protein
MTPNFGAWDIQEVTQTSPRLAYIHIPSHSIYVTNPSGSYSKYQADVVRQYKAHFNQASPNVQNDILPVGSIPANLFLNQDKSYIQYLVQSRDHYNTVPSSNPSQWSQHMLQHLQILDHFV